MYTKLLVLALATANALANSESTVRHIDTIIAAKPVERSHPKYPRFAAQKRQEGWVKMSFVIDKQGNVIEPIIENSSGIKSFERAALNAAKKWKYSPATENGEAIEQCKTSVQFDFKLQGQTGVTRKFSSNYKKIAKKMKDKLLNIVLGDNRVEINWERWGTGTKIFRSNFAAGAHDFKLKL